MDDVLVHRRPPVLDGADHVSNAICLAGEAVADSGALGTVRGAALTTVLAGLQPRVLWAATRK